MIWYNKDLSGSFQSKRKGLRIKLASTINEELKLEVKKYAKWLRTQYAFPIRIPVYLYDKKYLKTMDGGFASAVFFEPNDYNTEPYIKVAGGIRTEGNLKNSEIVDVLYDITHELTHYYQWLSCNKMTDRGRERQATNHGRRILWNYMMGRYAALYTQIIMSVPKCEDAYCQVRPIDKDVYGRVLFECKIIADFYDEDDLIAIAVTQKVTEETVFYYPIDSYKLYSKTAGITNHEIDELKEKNSWDMELNIDSCICRDILYSF